MIKILIIEDNNNLRENLTEILELENYQVITASNGIIGAEKVILEYPDFIVCDISMPQKNGFELYIDVQSVLMNRKIPFIFMSANSQEKEIAEGKNLGVDAYLVKPFKTEELLKTITVLM